MSYTNSNVIKFKSNRQIDGNCMRIYVKQSDQAALNDLNRLHCADVRWWVETTRIREQALKIRSRSIHGEQKNLFYLKIQASSATYERCSNGALATNCIVCAVFFLHSSFISWNEFPITHIELQSLSLMTIYMIYVTINRLSLTQTCRYSIELKIASTFEYLEFCWNEMSCGSDGQCAYFLWIRFWAERKSSKNRMLWIDLLSSSMHFRIVAA